MTLYIQKGEDLQPTPLELLLPNTRFVFPTGKLRPTTVFEGKNSNAWFDVSSFTDRTMNETKQVDGIKESILYLEGLSQAEIEILGDAGRVVVGGFSQGCAMVCMLMLSGVLDEAGIGGWVGMSGWLPFRIHLDRVARECATGPDDSVKEVYAAKRAAVKGYLGGLLRIAGEGGAKQTRAIEDTGPEKEQRLWMGHGKDDTKVLYEWGVQMKDLMKNLGVNVVMKTYEELGHSNNEQEMKDLVGFLEGRWAQYLATE
jgi:predicted esterase